MEDVNKICQAAYEDIQYISDNASLEFMEKIFGKEYSCQDWNDKEKTYNHFWNKYLECNSSAEEFYMALDRQNKTRISGDMAKKIDLLLRTYHSYHPNSFSIPFVEMWSIPNKRDEIIELYKKHN